MKQINNSPDKSVLLRETFNSEASVRLNGGVCANVDFKSGKAFFQNTGSITYSNPVLSIGAFTIRARVKLTIVNQYNVIASFDNVSTIELRTDLGGELVMYVDSVKKSSGKVLAVNTWYDIVVTRDDSGVIIFYVNGESFSGGTQAGIFYNKNLTIGKRGAGTTLYYNGYMDLFEYYDRSMTAAEITYILNDRAFRITDQVKRDRVAISGGTQGKIIYYKSLITFYRKRGMWDKTHLCLVPFLGYKASSGLIDTVYDLKGSILKNNDATQGTTANKPRISGYIAPNEVLAAKNPNGDSRFFTHPAISFAANQAWSVSVMVNYNGSLSSGAVLLGNTNTDTSVWLDSTVGGTTQPILFRNALNQDTATLYDTKIITGKNFLLTLVADGIGGLKLYINGAYITSASINTSVNFVRLFGVSGYPYMYGTSNYYRIQSGAMTPAQITAEYDLLRSWIPEIESVTIGSQVWASSNLDVVATPLGNVIPEVQTAGAVEKVTNGGFDTDTAWTKQSGWTISGGLANVNTAGTTALIFQNVVLVGKYVKCTYTISNYISGDIRVRFGSSQTLVVRSANGTYEQIAKVTDAGVSNLVGIIANGNTQLSIDNVSFQELNWSNATEIYDAVYAATSGDAATKHYAAVKEAAMWCYHGNSTALGSIYNKIYNGYSKGLQLLDLATATYGYHIATKAELQALGSSANALKAIGTNYWTTANGTNTTGKTLLGGAYRDDTTGAFGTIKETVEIWCADVDEVMRIEDGSDTITFAAVPKTRGAYIVYVKN